MHETALFDAMASDYDKSFSDTTIGILQRKRVYEFLHPLISGDKKLRILELNCGTGTDAIFFGRHGHQVLATDASPLMLEQVAKKIVAESLSESVKTLCCSFQQLPDAVKGQTFDLVFSNFGGLNCIDRETLKKVAVSLSGLLSPGGQCILVVMGTDCRWEQHYFLLKGKLRLMLRRFSKTGAVANYQNFSSVVFYHSPKTVASCFSPIFEVRRNIPIGLFIPPSYLNATLGKKRTILKILWFLEKAWGRFPIFSNLADHYLIQLVKA